MLGHRVRISILFSFLLLSLNAESRNFKNAYISFEMQDNWKCTLEQTEWVCRADDPQESKEAVIILTAKEKGPTDSFPLYENHLNGPINSNTKTGVALTSKVKYPSRHMKINGLDWLDGLHQDSEVQNYYTRYLATIKDQIAVLVTFSAHNKLYAKHSANFDKTIQSLRVVAAKDITSRPDIGPIGSANESLSAGISQAMPQDMIDTEGLNEGKKSIFKNELFLGFILLLVAAVAYIGLRIYQKNKN